MATDNEPDLRLRLFVWGYSSIMEPRIEYCNYDAWDIAIHRAMELSKSNAEPISRIQIVDAWGMLIAQFTHRSIFMGEKKFAEWSKNVTE